MLDNPSSADFLSRLALGFLVTFKLAVNVAYLFLAEMWASCNTQIVIDERQETRYLNVGCFPCIT
jgi:hypothetical protein